MVACYIKLWRRMWFLLNISMFALSVSAACHSTVAWTCVDLNIHRENLWISIVGLCTWFSLMMTSCCLSLPVNTNSYKWSDTRQQLTVYFPEPESVWIHSSQNVLLNIHRKERRNYYQWAEFLLLLYTKRSGGWGWGCVVVLPASSQRSSSAPGSATSVESSHCFSHLLFLHVWV